MPDMEDKNNSEVKKEPDIWELLLLLFIFSGGDPDKVKELLEKMLKEVNDGEGIRKLDDRAAGEADAGDRGYPNG